MPITRFFLVFFGACALTISADAARVLQAKNGKVMIDLEGQSADVNQKVVLVSPQKKRVAIAQINQVKNGKAIATVIKGAAAGNETVTFPAPKVAKLPPDPIMAKPIYKKSSRKWSVIASLMSNTMTTKQTDGTNLEDVAMKGSTFGLTGAIDYPVFESLSIRATLGYEPFKTTGTATYLSCDSKQSTNCVADITYLAAGGYARYDFTKPSAQIWLALGASLKYPMGNSTTALKKEDIKMTMTYGAALGLDFFLTNKMFIPVSVEQQMFLKSDTVSASILMIRAGYGQTF